MPWLKFDMENLKICRKKSGLTLDEAAVLLGISKSALTLYESGELSAPLSVIVKMLMVYNSNTYDLLGVNAPEAKYTDEEKLYNSISEHINVNISRMESARTKAGLIGYDAGYKEELFNAMFYDFIERIFDEDLREKVKELHKN